MKTFKITARIKTNLNLDSLQVQSALQQMIFVHPQYNVDNTVATIPNIRIEVED